MTEGGREPAKGPQAGGGGAGGGTGAPFAVLIFGFGAAAGLLLAFVGAGLVEDSGALILTVFLSALVILGGLGGLIFLFRRSILKRLFGYAETQVELFADPLTRVAEGALSRDATAATTAARDLVALALARYSWLSARRWIITSLTALIAAMAALAGTALLFKQNALLEAQTGLLARQNDLLEQQNAKVEAQTTLLSQEVQLAEAARNAQLAVEMTAIAAAIGEAAETAADEAAAAEGGGVDPVAALVNVIDPVAGLDRALMLRIVSISRAVRPYRFLDSGVLPDDPSDRMRVAMGGRREDLPGTYARIAAASGWAEAEDGNRLIDRPASPERGQLLQILLTGGVRNLEVLNHFGLDLNFALLQNSELILVTAGGARLSYADFSGSQVRGSDLGGSFLDNARFRRAVIGQSTFAEVGPDRVRPPFRPQDVPLPTSMVGADFGGAFVSDTDFAGATLIAARFDGAVLAGAGFSGATLGAASLKGAVILSADFTGADLRSADFDGAILFGEDPLRQIGAAAVRFAAERFRADPVTLDTVMALPLVNAQLSREDVLRITGGKPAWRITRVKAFDD